MFKGQYCVLITDKVLGGTSAYGPYRTLEKAQRIADLFTNPGSVNYYDPELYNVSAACLNKAE